MDAGGRIGGSECRNTNKQGRQTRKSRDIDGTRTEANRESGYVDGNGNESTATWEYEDTDRSNLAYLSLTVSILLPDLEITLIYEIIDNRGFTRPGSRYANATGDAIKSTLLEFNGGAPATLLENHVSDRSGPRNTIA